MRPTFATAADFRIDLFFSFLIRKETEQTVVNLKVTRPWNSNLLAKKKKKKKTAKEINKF